MASITVAKVIECYLADLQARVRAGHYSQSSYDGVSLRLLDFSAVYGSKSISRCKQHDLSSWLTARPAWKATHTKKLAVGAVIAAFNFAHEEELIDRRPYRRPRILRGMIDGVRRPATAAEYVALMSHKTSRELRRMLFLLRRTGMRTCEVRNLTFSQIFLDGEFAYISLDLHKTAHKSGKPRRIGLDPSTANFLRNLKRQAMRGVPAQFDPAPIVDDTPRACIKCGLTKKVSDFSTLTARGPRTKAAKTYRRSWCKTCVAEYYRWRRSFRLGKATGKGQSFAEWKAARMKELPAEPKTENFGDPRHGVHGKAPASAFDPAQRVFTNCHGRPWLRNSFCLHFRRAAIRVGLGEDVTRLVTAYCIRHTYVCDAIEAGVPIRSIADQVGHSSTAMIDKVYGSHTRGRIEHLSNVASQIVHARKKSAPADGGASS